MKNKVLNYVFILLCVIVSFLIVGITVRLINNEKWHVEITNDFINVRSEPGVYSRIVGKVEKGETYKVLDVNLDDKNYYWYYIEIDYFNTGWIASDRKNPYLKDFNNPYDIIPPTIKYYEDVYYVKSIDDINYNHLEVTDNTDYKIDHIVYYEEEQNQYWITYTVTDSGENQTSTTQKIVFETEPNKNELRRLNEK